MGNSEVWVFAETCTCSQPGGQPDLSKETPRYEFLPRPLLVPNEVDNLIFQRKLRGMSFCRGLYLFPTRWTTWSFKRKLRGMSFYIDLYLFPTRCMDGLIFQRKLRGMSFCRGLSVYLFPTRWTTWSFKGNSEVWVSAKTCTWIKIHRLGYRFSTDFLNLYPRLWFFVLKNTNIWQKSWCFWFPDFFPEIFIIHRLVWIFPMDFVLNLFHQYFILIWTNIHLTKCCLSS